MAKPKRYPKPKFTYRRGGKQVKREDLKGVSDLVGSMLAKLLVKNPRPQAHEE